MKVTAVIFGEPKVYAETGRSESVISFAIWALHLQSPGRSSAPARVLHLDAVFPLNPRRRPSRSVFLNTTPSFVWICRRTFMSNLIRCLAVALAIAFLPAAAAAQTGTIEGVVSDTTGAVLPGATVIVKNVATNLTRELTT